MSASRDVLVVGGGPAGSTVAALVASTGARVTLLERRVFPRSKVCGEFLSVEGCRVLERLGLLGALETAGAVRMGTCRLTDPSGLRLDARLPDRDRDGRSALGISRERLDAELLRFAAARGVDVRERCTALRPLWSGGRVTGVEARYGGGSRQELRARIVVAADGRRSMLVRHLHPGLGDPTRTVPGSWFGLETHLKFDPSRLEGRVDLHLFDGGYAGLGGVEGGRINLCLMTTVRALRACGGSPDRLLLDRVLQNPEAAAVIGPAPSRSRWNSVGPLRFGVRRPSAAGALFVGDAAGTIDPFCGEGMSNALCAAEIAAPFALRAANRGELASDEARRYGREWMRRFGPVTRRARLLGGLLARPRTVRVALRLLRGPARGLTSSLVAATRTGG